MQLNVKLQVLQLMELYTKNKLLHGYFSRILEQVSQQIV